MRLFQADLCEKFLECLALKANKLPKQVKFTKKLRFRFKWKSKKIKCEKVEWFLVVKQYPDRCKRNENVYKDDAKN